MPTFKEIFFFRFKSDEYKTEISRRYCSDLELRSNIYRKRAKLIGASCSTGICIGFAPFTAGVSAVGAALSARTLQIEAMKLRLLEKEWKNRGYPELPVRIFKDCALPCAISIACVGVDSLFLGAGSAAVQDVAHRGFHQLVSDTVQAGVAPSHASGAEFLHGAEDGVQQSVGLLAHNHTHFTAPAPCGPATAVGEWAGISVVNKGIDYGFRKVGEVLYKHS